MVRGLEKFLDQPYWAFSYKQRDKMNIGADQSNTWELRELNNRESTFTCVLTQVADLEDAEIAAQLFSPAERTPR